MESPFLSILSIGKHQVLFHSIKPDGQCNVFFRLNIFLLKKVADESSGDKTCEQYNAEFFHVYPELLNYSNPSQQKLEAAFIKALRLQLRCESIKLSNDSIKIINTILDLFSSAVIDSTQRERELEKRHLDNLKKEYKRA